MVLKYIYTVFLAILIVAFVGFGIAAFYKQPKYPEYPIELSVESDPVMKTSESAELKAKRLDYEKSSREFQKIIESYNMNVSIIALVAALVILVLSITILAKINFVSDGMLLGGVFTLIYSIIRGFSSGDEMFRFIVVSVGLIITIYLGYLRIAKINKSKN